MVIRIETDSGLVGYAPGQGTEECRTLIESSIVPFLEGRPLGDPDAMRVLFLKSRAAADPDVVKAYCMVEIGLYDLAGKRRGLPVSELLGGRVRDRIRLYGSAGMYMPPEKYAEEAAAVAALGFRAYKMRPGMGPEQDVETVRLMREAVGPDFDLMVDAHTWWRMGDRNYSRQTVDDLAKAMSEFDIAWLEEPLPPADHEGYRRLKELDYVPLASGEHEPSEEQFLNLILSEAVDFVQMDLICQGGYATGRRLMPEIATSGLSFAFHSWGTALEVVAAAHLGVCWPETVTAWLEYPCYSAPETAGMYPFPLAAEMLRAPLTIEYGDLVVPRGPGLGVDVDERVIDRYPWIPGPWSTFELISPPGTWAVTGNHAQPWADPA